MVEISNARICNIVSSVVQALLSMSIVGNLAARVWSLVVEWKKTRSALEHADHPPAIGRLLPWTKQEFLHKLMEIGVVVVAQHLCDRHLPFRTSKCLSPFLEATEAKGANLKSRLECSQCLLRLQFSHLPNPNLCVLIGPIRNVSIRVKRCLKSVEMQLQTDPTRVLSIAEPEPHPEPLQLVAIQHRRQLYILIEVINAQDSCRYSKKGPSTVEPNRIWLQAYPSSTSTEVQRGKSSSVCVQLSVCHFQITLSAGKEGVSEAAISLWARVWGVCSGSCTFIRGQ